MKRNIGVLMAIAGMMSSSTSINRSRYFESDEIKPVKKPCPAGCKEFTYYGHTVFALNEARAIKKCKVLAGIK